MLAKSARNLTKGRPLLWTSGRLFWRSASTEADEPAMVVERSPAAPGGGAAYRAPEKHFEEHDPLPVTFEDISRALYRIKDGIKRTNCTESKGLSDVTGCSIYVKKDFMQFTGSFKERCVFVCRGAAALL